MTARMTLSFHSPNMEESGTNLDSGTLEQRKQAFREDEELMKEMNKFVTEIIKTATCEAMKRRQFEGSGSGEGSRLKDCESVGRWNNRARGFCNRILNALCVPCITNNELFAWMPRYRFSRR